jgi:hypothetical protein
MDIFERPELRKLLRRNLTRLIIVGTLVNLFFLAIFYTSGPTKSPSEAWAIATWKVYYKLSPYPEDKLPELHKNAEAITPPQCKACHGEKGTKAKKDIHSLHLNLDIAFLQCRDCHKSITFGKIASEKVAKKINIALCGKCHGKFPGFEPNSAMKPEDAKADCTLCHSGKHALRHAQRYLSPIVSKVECYGCHGGRVLPWTPLHDEREWATQTHGPYALRIGADKCYSCHAYGLQFCDDCHKIKPDSHKPANRWKKMHKTRAKTFSESCYTCHEEKFCKKCHIKHTEGWVESHYKVVVKEGVETCFSCHHEDFCLRCHQRGPEIPAPPKKE